MNLNTFDTFQSIELQYFDFQDKFSAHDDNAS